MLSIEEFKKILENKKEEVPDEKLEFLYEFTNILTEKILDDWIAYKLKNKNEKKD